MTDEPPEPERPIAPPEDVPPVSAEHLVDGEPVVERRRPSTVGGAFYLVVLVLTGVGLAVVVVGDWRVGIRWMGAALVLGAIVRLALPSSEAGMLAVRHKLLDAALLVLVAGALVFLSGSIPDQPSL